MVKRGLDICRFCTLALLFLSASIGTYAETHTHTLSPSLQGRSYQGQTGFWDYNAIVGLWSGAYPTTENATWLKFNIPGYSNERIVSITLNTNIELSYNGTYTPGITAYRVPDDYWTIQNISFSQSAEDPIIVSNPNAPYNTKYSADITRWWFMDDDPVNESGEGKTLSIKLVRTGAGSRGGMLGNGTPTLTIQTETFLHIAPRVQGRTTDDGTAGFYDYNAIIGDWSGGTAGKNSTTWLKFDIPELQANEKIKRVLLYCKICGTLNGTEPGIKAYYVANNNWDTRTVTSNFGGENEEITILAPWSETQPERTENYDITKWFNDRNISILSVKLKRTGDGIRGAILGDSTPSLVIITEKVIENEPLEQGRTVEGETGYYDYNAIIGNYSSGSPYPLNSTTWLRFAIPEDPEKTISQALLSSNLVYSENGANTPGVIASVPVASEPSLSPVIKGRTVDSETGFYDYNAIIGDWSGGTAGKISTAWLKFNVPQYSGKRITRAVLHCYLESSYNGEYTPGIKVSYVSDDSWTQTTITSVWPATDSVSVANTDAPFPKMYATDITNWLQKDGEGAGHVLSIKLERTGAEERGALLGNGTPYLTIETEQELLPSLQGRTAEGEIGFYDTNLIIGDWSGGTSSRHSTAWLKYNIPRYPGRRITEVRLLCTSVSSYNGDYTPGIKASFVPDDSWTELDIHSDWPRTNYFVPVADIDDPYPNTYSIDLTPWLFFDGEGPGKPLSICLEKTGLGDRGIMMDTLPQLLITTEPIDVEISGSDDPPYVEYKKDIISLIDPTDDEAALKLERAGAGNRGALLGAGTPSLEFHETAAADIPPDYVPLGVYLDWNGLDAYANFSNRRFEDEVDIRLDSCVRNHIDTIWVMNYDGGPMHTYNTDPPYIYYVVDKYEHNVGSALNYLPIFIGKCKSRGLKLIISSSVFSGKKDPTDFVGPLSLQISFWKDYSIMFPTKANEADPSAETLIGWAIGDEPKTYDHFQQIEQIRTFFKKNDPKRFCAVVNQLNYTDTVVDRTNLPAICIDCYGILVRVDSSNRSYFSKYAYKERYRASNQFIDGEWKPIDRYIPTWFMSQGATEFFGDSDDPNTEEDETSTYIYEDVTNEDGTHPQIHINTGTFYWSLKPPVPAEIRWQIWETFRSQYKGAFVFLLTPVQQPGENNAPVELHTNPDLDPVQTRNSNDPFGPTALTYADGADSYLIKALSEVYEAIGKHKQIIRSWRKTDNFLVNEPQEPADFATAVGSDIFGNSLRSACFLDPVTNRRYCIVINNDLQYQQTIELEFDNSVANVTDIINNAEVSLNGENKGSVTLRAGDGTILEVK